MDPFVSNQISQIRRVKNSFIMNEKLRSRPNISELIEKNILRDCDLNFVGNNNNRHPFNLNRMNCNDLSYRKHTDDPRSSFNPTNNNNNCLRTTQSSNRNNAYNRKKRSSGIVLDPYEKQKIQYMLSDHLSTRPSPIDLLNCQILCPDLQYSDHLKNLNGDPILSSVHSFFDELSTRKQQQQIDIQKKPKKYSFHDVTPDKIKLSHSKNALQLSNNLRTVINKPIYTPTTSPSTKDEINSHHKRLIEQQTIYLNYEVARKNALINQLKKDKDELFNVKCKLECHNLNQNTNQPINFIDMNNINDSSRTNTFFNENVVNANLPIKLNHSTPSNNVRNDDSYTLNSDPLFSHTSRIADKNSMDSKNNCSVDDYLRKFDIDIPSQRRSTDPLCGYNPEYYSVSHQPPQFLLNENRPGMGAISPSYSNYSFTNGVNNSNINQVINSVSDVTFENSYNHPNAGNSAVDSSYPNSNNSDIFNSSQHLYNMNNGFSAAKNSNDFQKFHFCNYDTSQDHSSLDVNQIDFNSLVAFYELLADVSRNTKK